MAQVRRLEITASRYTACATREKRLPIATAQSFGECGGCDRRRGEVPPRMPAHGLAQAAVVIGLVT